jgi:hypothetical protein
VSTTYGIPANFDVIIEGARRPCRSIWRTDTKIGITFEKRPASTERLFKDDHRIVIRGSHNVKIRSIILFIKKDTS